MWIQQQYWRAPRLANWSAASLYSFPLWAEQCWNSTFIWLFFLNALFNSMKSRWFASGSPLTLRNPFWRQRHNRSSTETRKKSESVLITKLSIPSSLQSQIARVAPWISPALFVARPLTGDETFLKEKNHQSFVNIHMKSNHFKQSDKRHIEIRILISFLIQINSHIVIPIVENTITSTCSWSSVSKARTINPNVYITSAIS